MLATRASREQFEAVHAVIPEAVYEEASRTICLQYEKPELIGNGGGLHRRNHGYSGGRGGGQDCGVFRQPGEPDFLMWAWREFTADCPSGGSAGGNAIVAVAGMEGALPGVVAGLVEHPVIAVPTSVGYGAGFNGLSPLLTMLNSCAEGIAVVNIDNGFGPATWLPRSTAWR